MAGKSDGAYEHEAQRSGFGSGAAGDTPAEHTETDMPGRNQAAAGHGPETHQDTSTVRANPKMHDHKITAEDADPDRQRPER